MHKNLHIFVDPKTQQPLELKIEKEEVGHIVAGKLCNGSREYPIINGIPRFVGKEFYAETINDTDENETAKSFGDKWRDNRYQKTGFTKQDIQNLKEQFMAMLGCHSVSQLKRLLTKATKTLNAGCGVAWSEYLFNYNKKTERHCIDISLSVETAYQNIRDFKNIIVSQASIFELPYKDQTFDLIYSCGVLHHTPHPKKAFLSLVRKLTPGGRIGIYIYNVKPFLRELADREIRKITTSLDYDECMRFSRRITKLGRALSRIKQPLIIEEDIDLLGIKKGKYNLQRFIYDYFVKCWYNPKRHIKSAYLTNQDWYHPVYASHHTKEEMLAWFTEAGLKRVKCVQPQGWEHSGFFVSAIKN